MLKFQRNEKKGGGRGRYLQWYIITELKDHNHFSYPEVIPHLKINGMFNSLQLILANVKIFGSYYFRHIP